ncbi:MAG: ferrochelatase [Alphaproteobacteria bacterium]|nr:ferrochelatase [Alphaproteobacteria bacterium]MBU3972716.1 ferrochelatase [Alphaproteobacteria bacterium]MBU4038445.1 ferrochelatase [Alphaproteobacteria bacterium]MBU4136934.1 ferrochelatase [Alphaproteobacteria bacterium]
MSAPAGRRIAVVLFNLGGPDDQASVRPFLFNLFSDPAIIGLPAPFRGLLAGLISSRREKAAQANYALMGGGSPLLPETRRQAAALEQAVAGLLPGDEVRAFIAMRYWSPLSEETAVDVAAFGPDEIVLLPLYPQFSTTTTESSLKRWAEVYAGSGVSRTVCCYPEAAGWIEAQAAGVRDRLEKAGDRPVRVLFSAHGIPESLIAKKGDPYQEQIESTCAAIAARAGLADDAWAVCYQSRVGPMKWLGPSTPEAIARAGRDGVGVVVTPVAFVSEHIETLVELDIEYAELAHSLGVAPYLRAPAVGLAAPFIETLARATVEALGRGGVAPFGPGCRGGWKACPRRKEREAA